ncbi:6096_t:CDS:2, partial [Cetraspora pellucida]
KHTTNHIHCHPDTNFKTDEPKEDNNKTEIKRKSSTKEQTTSYIPHYYPDANLKTGKSKENNNKVSKQKSKKSKPKEDNNKVSVQELKKKLHTE